MTNSFFEIPGDAVFAVFDTETTGLFLYRDKETGQTVPADDLCQPRMASIAIILADAYGRALDSRKVFIKPDGWTIDGTEAGRVNGLTDAFLHEHGLPVAHALDIWDACIDRGLSAVAFNAQFDCKMMRAELRRANRPDRFEETHNICVMRALAPYAAEGLAMRQGRVKLSVACEFFGIVNENAHDAMSDAEAARAILEILIRDGRLPDAGVYYAAA